MRALGIWDRGFYTGCMRAVEGVYEDSRGFRDAGQDLK